MSSITAQQTKLDLELVPKDKRLKIGKCNRRLNPEKIQREPTFQVVLDALTLTPCYFIILITADVLEVYMHQFRDSVYKHDTFYRFKMDKRKRFKLNMEIFRDIFKICPRVHGQDLMALLLMIEMLFNLGELLHALHYRSLFWKTTAIDKISFSRAQILWGATPPKKARKFKKLASPQLTTVLISSEEPTGKLKRVKRPAKKSTKAPARGVVIRETPEMPLSKKKEKADVARGKGIELLFDVALTKEAQYKEVRRKSMRDFHKTHPSGSGTITKTAPSAAKIKPSVTNKGTGVKLGVPDVTEEESSESEAES
ncbi:hypothetical protein Tco_0586583 [Tanacetum coccineum]